jgi:O-antigen/teichoic acid export membrane protein
MRVQLKSILALWIGLLGGAGFVFLTQLVLARSLPLAELGILVGVISLITLLVPLADFGISALWLKLFGQGRETGMRWVWPGFHAVWISSICMMSLLLIVGYISWDAQTTRELLWWALLILPMEALVILAGTRLQLEGRFLQLSLWRALPKAARLFVVLVAWLYGWGVEAVVKGYFLTSAAILIIAVWHLRPLLQGNIKLEQSGAPVSAVSGEKEPTAGAIYKAALPFAMGNFFSLIYLQSDLFMLAALGNAEAAALYSIGFTLIALTYLLPTAVFNQYLLPRYHHWAAHEPARMLAAYRLGNASMLLIGLLVMLGVIVMAPFFLVWIFGQKFAAAALVTQILAVTIPVRYLASSVGNCLSTNNNMRHKMRYQMVVALLNVALNLLLIPRYGMYGAAIATVASEALLCLLYLYGVRKYVFGASALRGWSLNYKAVMK